MVRLHRRLVSRGYEMDARQRVTPGSLARYMELLRWDAISEGRFGLGALFASGHKLVVRAQDLTIGAPATHGTELDLEVGLARVGNSSLVLAHRATRVSDGVEVAQAFVTLVALDAQNKVARVPEAMRAEVEAVNLPAPLSFEAAVASDAFSRVIGIRPSDLDTLLHVNHSRYLDWADDTRTLMHAADAKVTYPARIAVDYRRETRLGHDLIARARVLADQPHLIAVDLCDAVDGELVARARIVGSP